MGLQTFIILTFRDGTKSSPITKELYDSETFRKNYELKIKSAKAVPFDSDEYLKISGLTREQVNALKPQIVEVKKEVKVTPFKFPEIVEDNSAPKLSPAKEVKTRGRKPAVKV